MGRCSSGQWPAPPTTGGRQYTPQQGTASSVTGQNHAKPHAPSSLSTRGLQAGSAVVMPRFFRTAISEKKTEEGTVPEERREASEILSRHEQNRDTAGFTAAAISSHFRHARGHVTTAHRHIFAAVFAKTPLFPLPARRQRHAAETEHAHASPAASMRYSSVEIGRAHRGYTRRLPRARCRTPPRGGADVFADAQRRRRSARCAKCRCFHTPNG